MAVTRREQFITGWYELYLIDSSTKEINLDRVVRDPEGHVMFFVTVDKVYYNFHSIISIRRLEKK